MPSVIFDLDGTLADTSADLIAAANACFRDLGLGNVLDPGRDAVTAFRGGKAMLTLGFERSGLSPSDAEIDRHWHRFVAHYNEGICNETRLYPGAMETVEVLKGQGYAVGICTNKPGKQTDTLLARLGIAEAFGAVVAADTLPVRKPDPEPLREAVRRLGRDPARSCLIGDTDTDRKTARAAGVPCVLVTFGPAGESVLDYAPEAVIDDFAALPDVIKALDL